VRDEQGNDVTFALKNIAVNGGGLVHVVNAVSMPSGMGHVEARHAMSQEVHAGMVHVEPQHAMCCQVAAAQSLMCLLRLPGQQLQRT
jgi:hypothetical protein